MFKEPSMFDRKGEEMKEKENFKKMIVARIEVDDDRILFYDSAEEHPLGLDYYAIADRTRAARKVKVGDEIQYEPDGANFGWFIEKVE